MNYYSVKNWETFQHYKDRSPPWIKLHRDLLRDYDFSCLQDASKLQLMLLWLLASQLDNKIPTDPAWITRQLGLSEPINLKPLIDNGFILLVQDASKALADCKQSAIVETEAEAYKQEAEREQKTRKPKKTGKRLPKNWQPSKELLTWAMTERTDLDIKRVIDSFTDYWIAKTGSTATKLDWDATFRNWVRNEKSNRSQQTGNGQRQNSVRDREQRNRAELERLSQLANT